VCQANSSDITSGLQYVRPTKEPKTNWKEPEIRSDGASVTVGKKSFTIKDICMAMVSHPTHASKSRVFKHYDKNILGNTVIELGEADAIVIMLLADLQSYEMDGEHPGWTESLKKGNEFVGVALACGGNGRYGRISPYLQGVNALVENVRNIAAVGALPRAISDCLNYGNPEIPEQLWALEQGVKGIADAAKALEIDGEAIPVVSGNVSLYNATKEGPIDPTANVCVIGVMIDARNAIDMRLKKAGSIIYLLGDRKNECGGSAYYQILETLAGAKRNELLGANVPSPDMTDTLKQIHFLSDAIEKRLLLASHDISDGGLFLSLFEMTTPQRKIGGNIGLSVNLESLGADLRTDTLLFSETGGFVLEVDEAKAAEMEKLAKKHKCVLHKIGETLSSDEFILKRGSAEILHSTLKQLQEPWSKSVERALQSI
jgi:phosphoribosylformylglycinamidine synthase